MGCVLDTFITLISLLQANYLLGKQRQFLVSSYSVGTLPQSRVSSFDSSENSLSSTHAKSMDSRYRHKLLIDRLHQLLVCLDEYYKGNILKETTNFT